MQDVDVTSLFLAHIAVADAQIHTREAQAIHQFLDSQGSGQSLKDEIQKIFADSDDKISQDEVIARLVRSNPETQRQALITGLAVAYSDGFFQVAERDLFLRLINRTGFLRDEYLDLKEMTLFLVQNDTITEQTVPLLHLVAETHKSLIQTLADHQQAEHTPSKPLLSGQEYDTAIRFCADIAMEDFRYVEHYFREGTESLQRISLAIQDTLHHMGQEEGVADSLKSLQTRVREKLLDRLEHYRKSINSKHQALRSYTVSFVGKTKVGKSTLHAVICGEGHEFIGVGKQRTTRYNRVYTWQNLRVIDTPGIGAPGGKTDEQIARSIVDESDIICFMTKNDSIQETEFEFLKFIRQWNKPILFLLNVKDNIEDPGRLRRYLEDSERWYNRNDEKSLAGHKERIRRYARTYYQNDRFRIYPVHLLAARMSQDSRYQKDAETLYTSSHMQDFLDALRQSILQEGVLRRSQTILDGMLAVIDETQRELDAFKQYLRETRSLLQRKGATLERDLQKQHATSARKLEATLRASFGALLSETYGFATLHYEETQEKIQQAWKNRLIQAKLEHKLETSLKRCIEEYREGVQGYLDEIGEDLKAAQKIRFEHGTFQGSSTFSYHTILDIGSLLGGVGGVAVGLLGLAGVLSATVIPPVAIAMAAIASLQLFKWFFKSKQQVHQEAIDTLYQSLNKHLEQQRDQTIQTIRQNFDQQHQQVLTHIQSLFASQVTAIDQVLAHFETFERQLRTHKREITRVFAWRIVNYAIHGGQNPPVAITDQAVSDTIAYTERNRGGRFIISCNTKAPSSLSEQLSDILQEEVIIRG